MRSPLNRHLTVHLSATCPIEADKEQKHLRDLMRRATEKRVGSFAAVWTREPSVPIGEHIHIAYHGNPTLDAVMPELLEAWTGSPADQWGVRKSEQNEIVCQSKNHVWKLTRFVKKLGGNDMTLIKYLIKSLNKPNGRGQIMGKRAGTSRSVGEETQKNSCPEQST